MARPRFRTPVTGSDLTANFPTSVMTDMQFMDVFNFVSTATLHEIDDEEITLSDYSASADGLILVDLEFKIGRGYDDPDYPLVVSTGAGGTGTVFTNIGSWEDFGADSLRECRVLEGDGGKIEFKNSQLVDAGLTSSTLYVNYYGRHSNQSASKLAQIVCELLAVQTHILDSEGETVTFGENVTKGLGYILAADGECYQFDDPTDAAQLQGLVYIQADASENDTGVVLRRGPIEPDEAVPINKTAYAGNNGAITWNGDATNPLTSGDYILPIGVSLSSGTLQLEISPQIQGVMP